MEKEKIEKKETVKDKTIERLERERKRRGDREKERKGMIERKKEKGR